ncbi:YceI family protein [Novosphingobium sp.]|uniref:YceI family protein n=2 Tax=unclassified Novosphingobium TaxID=2644732 RepID=UPI0038BA8A09
MTLSQRACLPIAMLTMLAPLTASAQETLRYVVDKAASHVDAKVAFFGFSSKSAHFPDMTGTFDVSPTNLEGMAMAVDIDARTLTTGDSETQRLRGRQFFDVAHHPILHFVGSRMTMTGAKSATVEGKMTARGVTQPVKLAVTFSIPPIETAGYQPITITGTTTIDRYAFGMRAFPWIIGRMVAVRISARMVRD